MSVYFKHEPITDSTYTHQIHHQQERNIHWLEREAISDALLLEVTRPTSSGNPSRISLPHFSKIGQSAAELLMIQHISRPVFQYDVCMRKPRRMQKARLGGRWSKSRRHRVPRRQRRRAETPLKGVGNERSRWGGKWGGSFPFSNQLGSGSSPSGVRGIAQAENTLQCSSLPVPGHAVVCSAIWFLRPGLPWSSPPLPLLTGSDDMVSGIAMKYRRL